jgi:hypothetical protein
MLKAHIMNAAYKIKLQNRRVSGFSEPMETRIILAVQPPTSALACN